MTLELDAAGRGADNSGLDGSCHQLDVTAPGPTGTKTATLVPTTNGCNATVNNDLTSTNLNVFSIRAQTTESTSQIMLRGCVARYNGP